MNTKTLEEHAKELEKLLADFKNTPDYLHEPIERDSYEEKFGENYTGGYAHQDL